MTKHYKPFVDYECIDYVGDLNEFEAHILGHCLTFRGHLQLCGVASEDVDLERLTSDLIMCLTQFALRCNSFPTRAPKRISATVQGIRRDPKKFLNGPQNYDPVENYLVMSATARLSAHHAQLVMQHQLNEGLGPKYTSAPECSGPSESPDRVRVNRQASCSTQRATPPIPSAGLRANP